MGWRDLPTWLKGGIIFVLIVIVIDVVDYLILPLISRALFPLQIANYPLYLFWQLSESGTINLILHLSLYFVVGAIIGWIVGKIKSKKQAQMPVS